VSNYQPTKEDYRFFSELSADVRSHPDLYQFAGKWLDRTYSAEAFWQQEIEEAERPNREHPLANHREPREKHIVESKFSRICTAVRDFLKNENQMITVPTWEESARVLLLCWLLTDEAAHRFQPKLCEFQDWGWDGDPDEQFSRQFSQATTLSYSEHWKRWLSLCSKAWMARPNAEVSSLPERLNRIAEALEKFDLKAGVCLRPDATQWPDNPTVRSVLSNLKRWELAKDDEHQGMPLHIVNGMFLQKRIADEMDLVLDEQPKLALRWDEDFKRLWADIGHLAEEFKHGRDDYDISLTKMMAVALRVEKLADRVRKTAELYSKPRSNGKQEEHRPTQSNRDPKIRLKLEVAEPLIFTYLQDHPKATAEDVKNELQRKTRGGSTGLVKKSNAWKANQRRLEDAKQNKKDPIALSLQDYHIEAGQERGAQINNHRQHQAELDEEIDKQEQELFRRIGEYQEEHPESEPQQIAKAVGCTAGDVERRQTIMNRLITEQVADEDQTHRLKKPVWTSKP